METFGNFVHVKRVSRDITLREFCRSLKLDASNWSKVERGHSPAPQYPHLLNLIADRLSLRKEDRNKLIALSAADNFKEHRFSDKEVLQMLPLLLKRPLPKENLIKIYELVKRPPR